MQLSFLVMQCSDTVSKFSVFLCIPKRITRHIRVSPHDPVSVLAKSFGQRKVSFVCKGVLLNPQTTFEYCRITPKDTIIALEESVGGQELARWQKITETRGEQFSNSIQFLMNKETRKNCLIKLDVALARSELKPRTFRKMVKRYELRENNETSSLNHSCVIPPPAQEISDEPLPIIWYE